MPRVASKPAAPAYERAKPSAVQMRIWATVGATPPLGMALIGYGGAAGGGKTRALVELAMDLATDFPGNIVLIGRKDFSDLRDTTMKQFEMYCPAGMIVGRNLQEHWVDIRLEEWPDGVKSRILFRELKDYLGIASAEYGAVLIDEAGEVPHKTALMLLSRLRHQLPPIVMETEMTPDTPWGRKGPGIKYVFFAASNPWPGWFKEWFVDRELPEDALRTFNGTIHFIPALAKDNPYLPKDYEQRLRAIYPADWVQRLMDGRWDAFVGQVYPAFSPMTHEWRWRLPTQKDVIKVIGGLDFGGQNPHAHMSAGCVSLVLRSNRIITVAEFEQRGQHVVENQMRWMLEQQALWCTRETGPLDWRADRSQMLGISLWRKMGFNVKPSKGGPDSVLMGVAMCARRFDLDPIGLPGAFYVPAGAGVLDWNGNKIPGCTQLPARLTAYRYSDPKEDDKPVQPNPLKVGDDLPDAWRYHLEGVDRMIGDPQMIRRGLPVVTSMTVAGVSPTAPALTMFTRR